MPVVQPGSGPSTIRIFISSPGDVAEEREKAKQVVAQLQTFYGDLVTLAPVLWEDLPLELDQPFQNGIDVVLETHPIDIAVFILWSAARVALGQNRCWTAKANPTAPARNGSSTSCWRSLRQTGGNART